jgi:hypothetical protein
MKMKIIVFWDVIQCSMEHSYKRSGQTCSPNPQGGTEFSPLFYLEYGRSRYFSSTGDYLRQGAITQKTQSKDWRRFERVTDDNVTKQV